MKMEQYEGKKVTLFGLGRYEHGSGIAAAKFLLEQGAELLISDLQSKEELAEQVQRLQHFAEEKNIADRLTWRMGQHSEEDILHADLFVANQAIPVTSKWIQFAKEKQIPIETEMTLFFKNCPAKIVGITGTRGKSTTTSLIYHLLKANGRSVHVGGNITLAALELLPKIDKYDLVVLELSNFMLEYLNEQKLSPSVAVLLNVLPDHLSRYDGSMDAYAAVKEVITKYQTEEDTLICNRQNSYTNEIGQRSKANVIWYDSSNPQTEINTLNTALLGAHNQENILAAIKTVQSLGLNESEIQEALQSYRPLDGRLQFIEEVNGVTFINDTTSTTPVAAIAAIEALRERPLVLIAGGADKGLSFSEFVEELSKLKAVIWLPGDGTDRIFEEIDGKEIDVEFVKAESMDEAVRLAFSRAEANDLVLLSPACSSFGLFKNEFDRGDQYNLAVKALKERL